MASIAASRPISFADDQPFFVRLSAIFVLFALGSFAQFDLRGFVDLRHEPIWVHVHAVLMVSWLGLFLTQNVLATRDLRMHRQIGYIAFALMFAILVMASYTAYKSLELHHNLEGYNPAWALSQESIALIAFLGLVTAGILARHATQWHRRLMFGATVIIAINPAMARALPPAVSAEPPSGWLVLAVEVAFLSVLALHDRKVLGRLHPATATIAAVILAGQSLMVGLAYSGPFQSLASNLM